MARIYAEHPDNVVAERKLIEAALDLARSLGVGPQQATPFNPFTVPDPFTGGWAEWVETMRKKGTGVRPASRESAAAYKQAKRRAEAVGTPEERRRRAAEEQERKAEEQFKRDRKPRDPKDDTYPF